MHTKVRDQILTWIRHPASTVWILQDAVMVACYLEVTSAACSLVLAGMRLQLRHML
jgi:hypothetical protein